jgi:hypothetical protein
VRRLADAKSRFSDAVIFAETVADVGARYQADQVERFVAELSASTFSNFAREFSSFMRKGR